MVKFSIVVPMYNEEGNVSRLDQELKRVMRGMGSFEIIYVNDGSRDDTLKELLKLKQVKILDLNKNYGQATALDAGFRESDADYVITIDGDLQNNPKDIPRLYRKLLLNKLDVVAGWRVKRKDKLSIRLMTAASRRLRRLLMHDPVHDTGCTLRIYTREAAKSLELWGEMHRYILGLLKWKGFRIGEIEVEHRRRIRGRTKYGYDKLVKGFIDLLYMWFISKYSSRPLHLFGTAGLASFTTGLTIEAWMVYEKIFYHIDLSNNGWFILGFFFIIAGVMAFTFGLMLDLLVRVHLNNSPTEKRYYIRRKIDL